MRPFDPADLTAAVEVDYRARSAGSKLLLLVGSLLFIRFVAGDWWTPLFILAVAMTSYGAIALLDRLIEVRRRRADVAVGAVALVFAMLISANYLGVIGTLTGTPASLTTQWPILLGISFYALQIVGVAADVLRGEIGRPGLLSYLVFVLLGFKFYSGPMQRGVDLDRIVNHVALLNADGIWAGFSWALLGFFMKFVVANPLANFIVIETTNPVATLAVGAVAELRFYFDFAGYSFMALGCARLAGIELICNFQQPLFAGNIRDFWRRWHVGLGHWLGGTIYRPARAELRAANLPTEWLAPSIFLVSALWHGATINFLLWGVLHGVAFFLFVRVLSRYRWHPLLGHSAVLCLLILGRTLFIDPDFPRLAHKLAAFGDPAMWSAGARAAVTVRLTGIAPRSAIALVLALMFLVLEPISQRRYGRLDYRLFRTIPGMAIILGLVLSLAYQQPDAIFVYARN